MRHERLALITCLLFYGCVHESFESDIRLKDPESQLNIPKIFFDSGELFAREMSSGRLVAPRSASDAASMGPDDTALGMAKTLILDELNEPLQRQDFCNETWTSGFAANGQWKAFGLRNDSVLKNHFLKGAELSFNSCGSSSRTRRRASSILEINAGNTDVEHYVPELIAAKGYVDAPSLVLRCAEHYFNVIGNAIVVALCR